MTTMDDVRIGRRDEAAEPDAEITLAFDNNKYASLVFGHYDQNLAKIERRLKIASFANGNHVTLKGKTEACEHARRVLEALYEAREKKIARAIGITSHANPAGLRDLLERHDFDCTQMALNAGLARMADLPGGMKATPAGAESFERLALPVAIRKQMGVIAMKVFGQEQLIGAASVEKLLAYALSLPVSLASLGMPRLEHIERNAALARTFTPLTEPQRREISESIARTYKTSMLNFFQNHQDA